MFTTILNYLWYFHITTHEIFEEYKKILEFVPTNKNKINDQILNLENILLTTIGDFVYSIIKNYGNNDNNENNENDKINSKKIIVSLSGGVDSMVLTTILKYLDYNVIGIHINYNNREETRLEQEFLEKWCNYNDIKLYVKSIENFKRENTKRSDYEVITKKIRFDFYKEVMNKENINFILLGHHKDDIVENIFANTCRGRNILDLAVIKKKCIIENVNIARPMLDFYKTTIYQFADTYQVPYFKDTTPEWSVRGKYRNTIYPLLEDVFSKNVKENLIGLSNQSNEWNELIQYKIIKPFLNNITYTTNEVTFNVEDYYNYPMSFWCQIFTYIFSHYNKSIPSRKAIQTFMNNIKTKNVCYISLSNSCVCYNKNYFIKINFK